MQSHGKISLQVQELDFTVTVIAALEEQIYRQSTTTLMFRSLFTVGTCEALGVADPNTVPDDKMTASSVILAYNPYEGRLNGNSAWCPSTSSNLDDYLQIDMESLRSVCAVATQGKSSGSYVSSYKLSFSTDGVTWNTYQEQNQDKVTFLYPLL